MPMLSKIINDEKRYNTFSSTSFYVAPLPEVLTTTSPVVYLKPIGSLKLSLLPTLSKLKVQPCDTF